MRAVVTRVSQASVSIDGAVCGQIGPGLLVLLGVGPSDTPAHSRKLADKILGLRIFSDADGKMNRSLADIGGEGAGGEPVYPLWRLPQGPASQLHRRCRSGTGTVAL